jgi:hypothetical protein
MVTLFIFGSASHNQIAVKNYTLFYYLISLVSHMVYKKWIGSDQFSLFVKNKSPTYKSLRFLDLVILGHGIGFETLAFINNLLIGFEFEVQPLS